MEVKEFGVPDTVKSMSWCGENICLGIRREYKILNTTNGVLSEVFSSGRIAAPLVVALPPGELLLGKVMLVISCRKVTILYIIGTEVMQESYLHFQRRKDISLLFLEGFYYIYQRFSII